MLFLERVSGNVSLFIVLRNTDFLEQGLKTYLTLPLTDGTVVLLASASAVHTLLVEGFPLLRAPLGKLNPWRENVFVLIGYFVASEQGWPIRVRRRQWTGRTIEEAVLEDVMNPYSIIRILVWASPLRSIPSPA
jgi:hypothetical protein